MSLCFGATAASSATSSSSSSATRIRTVTNPAPFSRSHHRHSSRGRCFASPATAAASAAPLDTLRSACKSKTVAPDNVVLAMEALEADVQGVHAPGRSADFPPSLTGTWRLVFAVPAPIPAWAYIPVREDAIINVEKGDIALVSFVGPLSFRFEGRCSFRCQPEAGVFDMDFSFTTSQVKVFDWELPKKERAAAKNKTYSFFALAHDVAAVRSSATGGKTLMYRV